MKREDLRKVEFKTKNDEIVQGCTRVFSSMDTSY